MRTQGAFRLWIVATALWIGHFGWSIDEGHSGRPWSTIVSASFENSCWTSEQSWYVPPPAPSVPHKKGDFLTEEEVFGVQGIDRYNADIRCEYENGGTFPRLFLLRLITQAASLPVGLLALWFVAGWVRSGFRSREVAA